MCPNLQQGKEVRPPQVHLQVEIREPMKMSKALGALKTIK